MPCGWHGDILLIFFIYLFFFLGTKMQKWWVLMRVFYNGMDRLIFGDLLLFFYLSFNLIFIYLFIYFINLFDQSSLTIFAPQVWLDNATLTCPYFIILLFILSNSVYCKLQILFSYFFFFFPLLLIRSSIVLFCFFIIRRTSVFFFFLCYFYFTRHIHQGIFFPLLHLHTFSTNYLKSFIPRFAFFRTFSHRFFRIKQNGIFLALEEKIHFSTSFINSLPSSHFFNHALLASSHDRIMFFLSCIFISLFLFQCFSSSPLSLLYFSS